MPNIISIGQATAIIPAKAQIIIATAANTKINKHKVIIVVPPFNKQLLVHYRRCKFCER